MSPRRAKEGRPAGHHTQFRRALAILGMLGRKEMSQADIAGACDCTERTARRYLAVLCSEGLAVRVHGTGQTAPARYRALVELVPR